MNLYIENGNRDKFFKGKTLLTLSIIVNDPLHDQRKPINYK